MMFRHFWVFCGDAKIEFGCQQSNIKFAGFFIPRRRLIAKQFFQLRARGGFALGVSSFRCPDPAYKFKILAEIADVFFQHRFSLPFAALLGHARVVMRAVQADTQIRAAAHASFTTPRLAGQRPFLAAVVAMAGHSDLGFAIFDLLMRQLYPRKS
jgi:hypothetical protein